MEKELFLLGLIRNSELYGYQINELIDSHFNVVVNITRATAYRLLSKMADEGYIVFREEYSGNHPPRKMFTITTQGELYFQKILRMSLSEYHPEQKSGLVSFAFLETLPQEELKELLSKRRKLVLQQEEKLKESKKHQTDFQMMFDHQFRHLETERVWIDDIINRLNLNGSNN
ncbi:MAG: hypothetical protein CL609_02090 [Anaerolineaceae bacterium]|nr:hypothetical protein [Anaerolineaceae bacterium]